MSQIPYFDSTGILNVEVQLTHAANVFLVNSTNFQKYKNGQDYTYHGGYYTKSPVRIRVSGSGRWYLIVEGSRHYKYRCY